MTPCPFEERVLASSSMEKLPDDLAEHLESCVSCGSKRLHWPLIRRFLPRRSSCGGLGCVGPTRTWIVLAGPYIWHKVSVFLRPSFTWS